MGNRKPETSNNLSKIDTRYRRTDGYGEISVERALEALFGGDIEEAPSMGIEYGLDRTGATEAWSEGLTGFGIVIAVLDTGVDINHIDLDRNIWVNTGEIAGDGIDNDGNGYIDDVNGWDMNENDNVPDDVDGHGTHVAGTIAAENNRLGTTGVAFNAKIMPVKVLGDDGSGSYDDVVEGIYYAVRNGADIINMSLGGGYYMYPPLAAAIKYASQQGVVVVMAAGNSGGDSPEVPASYASEHGIAVGSVGADGEQSEFSNRAGGATDYEGDGTRRPLYVTAPGENIYSTLPNNYVGALSGTSMATPHVSAAVALLLEAHPGLTPKMIRILLANTAN